MTQNLFRLAALLALISGCAKAETTVRPPIRPQASAAPTAGAAPVVETAAPMVEEWTRSLANPDPGVRHQALESAAALGEPGFPVLLEGLHNPVPEVRLQALRVMHKSVMTEHADEILPVVTRLLVDPHPQVRQEMVGRIDWLGADSLKTLTPRLREIASTDSDPGVRTLAAGAIVNLNGSYAGLIGLLQDRNPLIRQRAVLQLGGLETEGQKALPHLNAVAANDPSPEVRQAAQETIASLSGTER